MRCLIIFASIEGQTERIADRIAHHLRDRGIPTDVYNTTDRPIDQLAVDSYDAVVLGSSIHYANHDPEIGLCIREHRSFLERIPSAFFSVSLGVASKHAEDREGAAELADRFLAELNWKPSMVAYFAGALKYSRYGWLKRRLMHWIAKHSTDMDVSPLHDHEYTDWQQVRTFAEDFAALLMRKMPRSQRHQSAGV